MKLTLDELLSMRPKALKNRVLCYSQYENMSGSKPRDSEETLMLAVLTVNRLKKAVESGLLVFEDEGLRRIEYHG